MQLYYDDLTGDRHCRASVQHELLNFTDLRVYPAPARATPRAALSFSATAAAPEQQLGAPADGPVAAGAARSAQRFTRKARALCGAARREVVAEVACTALRQLDGLQVRTLTSLVCSQRSACRVVMAMYMPLRKID